MVEKRQDDQGGRHDQGCGDVDQWAGLPCGPVLVVGLSEQHGNGNALQQYDDQGGGYETDVTVTKTEDEGDGPKGEPLDGHDPDDRVDRRQP